MLVEEDEEVVEDVVDEESDLAEPELEESDPELSDFFSVEEVVVTGAVDLPEPRLSLR
ncbi:hypothetical protein GCM10009550_17810 [Actinocorallia libanotica]|uniref:Uncharacterized protein n=1 Tax=Actinocorallia libanotica TaxID=46162 RepID=A0ABN1QN69_9ACTN